MSATSKRKITFSVDGRPPRKFRNKSLWGSKQEAPLVKKLREHALKERNNKKLGECFYGKIEMNLKIFSNKKLILDETAAHDHIGDLDAFIAGIFESLQPAHKQALKFLDPIFKKDEVYTCSVCKAKVKGVIIGRFDNLYTCYTCYYRRLKMDKSIDTFMKEENPSVILTDWQLSLFRMYYNEKTKPLMYSSGRAIGKTFLLKLMIEYDKWRKK